jgi:hypothetical protein
MWFLSFYGRSVILAGEDSIQEFLPARTQSFRSLKRRWRRFYSVSINWTLRQYFATNFRSTTTRTTTLAGSKGELFPVSLWLAFSNRTAVLRQSVEKGLCTLKSQKTTPTPQFLVNLLRTWKTRCLPTLERQQRSGFCFLTAHAIIPANKRKNYSGHCAFRH